MRFIKRYWPILIFGFIVLFLSIVNYRPGMILTGGDNLHTEFNFPLNISRSIFSVWVEYEGLGVLAGMGHASDLVRQLFLWLLSVIIPMNFLRYVYTMLTLFVGSIGGYYLVKKILYQALHHPHELPSTNYLLQVAAFLGGIFYLLNLATLQQYYTPFEVFTTSFAALPWLFLVTINFFQRQSVKNLLLLSLVLFLATPQAVVPTVFVVWLMATGILTIFLSIKQNPFAFSPLPFAKYYLLVFLINAFWLLPFAYFVLTSANIDVNAKINQMGSENIYSLNKEFGNIQDVMLLRGFWFQNVEPDFKGNITYMLLPWKDYMANPLVPAIGYLLFIIIVIGLISAIRSKKLLPLGFVTIFFFSFLMLTTATPPFAQINDFLRTLVPLFKEVFRFPFTKFSTLLSLMFAIFFAFGAYSLIHSFKAHHGKLPLIGKFVVLCLAALPAIFMLPAFQGKLFYDRERILLPKAYRELFSKMENEDLAGRVALFPANTFWDWKFYSWGYSGSGFLWYGIRQPILDRAFDMWGTHNENYYNELSQALYSKDTVALSRVLQKYDIKYLIVDTSVIYPPAPQSLLTRELPQILANLPGVTQTATYGTLRLYTIDLPNSQHNFVSLANPLPIVNATTWNNNDQAYTDLGDYISPTDSTQKPPTQMYPFRSLFSGKNQEDKTFSLTEKATYLQFSQKLEGKLPENAHVSLPSFIQNEAVIPAQLTTETLANGQVRVNISVSTPEVLLGEKKVSGAHITRQIALLPNTATASNLQINVNGLAELPLSGKNAPTIFLSLKQDNILVISTTAGKKLSGIVIIPEAIKNLPELVGTTIPLGTQQPGSIQVRVPKINDAYLSYTPDIAKTKPIENCNIFRKGDASAAVTNNNGLGQLQVQARNGTTCTSFFTPDLPHDQGYGIFITTKNEKGKPFHFWLVNEDEKFAPIDTNLPKGNTSTTSSFVLPPQDAFGTAYSFHVDNASIGNEVTKNTLEKLSVYQIPYRYLTNIKITDGKPVMASSMRSGAGLTVTHPNETFYTVTTPKLTSDKTLILSQSYDPGWHLYRIRNQESGIMRALASAFPFFLGNEIKNHVMVNGWANGWQITPAEANGRTLIITYLPQYLEYIGFVLLGATGIYLALIALRKPKHQNTK